MKKVQKPKSLEKYQKIGILLLVVVIAGFFGWTYEMIFYFFDGGMMGLYMQGGNFLPWINIYAIGALVRKSPANFVYIIQKILPRLVAFCSSTHVN